MYRLHHVTGQDGERLTYDLLAERPPEANISHRGMPSAEEHRKFYHSNPYRAWLAIIPTEPNRRTAVGTVLLTWRNEIGIAILTAYQRRGYARRALRELLATYPPLPAEPSTRTGYYVANVAPGNQASIALFRQFGPMLQHTFRIHP